MGYGHFSTNLTLSGAVINRNRTGKIEYLHHDSGTVAKNFTVAGVAVATIARVTTEQAAADLGYPRTKGN